MSSTRTSTSDDKSQPAPPTTSTPLQLTSLFPITLKFEEVFYTVKVEKFNNSNKGCWAWGSRRRVEKTILNGITGMVCPGELLALLGPSGSGKTTFLTALSGRSLSGKLSGKISYNARPFCGWVKRRTGFVAQDDVLYPHLTVWETLLFTALLRLPESLSGAEKGAHVERVVGELGLGKCRNSVIGGPLLRGISGGEKKRVSIGQEMLINPSVVLLDEPTSGLDSTAARRIVGTLKGLAAGGRTVVTTIHQPSSRLYHMFDKVVLLSEGRAIYNGDAEGALDYFEGAGFLRVRGGLRVNPADVMLDLANGEFIEEEEDDDTSRIIIRTREALAEAYEKSIAPRVKQELQQSQSQSQQQHPITTTSGGSGYTSSWCHQFRVLFRRGIKERRHETFNRLRVFQVISVALLGGLLWWRTPESHLEDRVALLFFFSVFWGFYPLYNAVFTFPQERAMLSKERSSGMYRLSAYFLAKTVGDLPLELALPTAFVFIIYWMGGLDPHPLRFLLSLMVVLYSVLVSQSLGLAMGAVLMDIKKATTLASVTTLVFLMAGGYYVQHIPPFILWLKYVSYSYYSYKLLLGVQYSDPNQTYQCHARHLCRVGDFPAIASMGLNHLWIDVSIMFLMLIGYRFLAYLALTRLTLT